MTSRTGLIASPTKKIYRRDEVSTIQMRAIARPAPFTLKRFAGLYNPYSHGCSLLCNHPTDSDAKEMLKKAKDSWAADGKNLLLTEEIEAIRAGLQQFQTGEVQKHSQKGLDSVPEELFRRYTETDSRPLTPVPTLASAATRASGSRRCVTPDPLTTNQIREKTLLILDLRRSHSQETLSWHGSSLLEPPIIKIQRVPTRTASFEESCSPKTKSPTHLLPKPGLSRSSTPSSSKAFRKKTKDAEEGSSSPKDKQEEKKLEVFEEEETDDEFIKRRGKKRRKKREGSGGATAFQTPVDPETQVATIGPDSHNTSARPSIVALPSDELQETVEKARSSARPSKCWDIDSFLDVAILKQLRRELNEEVVENEFNHKRRAALQEALKTIPKDKTNCEALTKIQNELKLPPVNTELWLSLPRVFTRSSARFELPLDSRSLETMTPISYARNHVSIASPRKLLYNCIFNKFKIAELEHSERRMRGKVLFYQVSIDESYIMLPVENKSVLAFKAYWMYESFDIQSALNLMMGKPMTGSQVQHFRDLIGWSDDDVMDFKTFCGLCAICERLLAPEYCTQLPDRQSDPCHEIESADFEALKRKLHGKKVDPNLVAVLHGIKTR